MMNDEQEPRLTDWIQSAAVENPRAKRLWILKVVLLGMVAVLLVPFIAPTVGRIAAGLRYPYQMDSEEGFVCWQAWQLRHGHNIFRRLDSPPYVAATYGPLYPLINAALLWGKTPTLLSGRLIAALSVVAICLFMAMTIWRETRQILAALLGPLLFLNSYDVYQWLPFYRVDFPALALGMAGLWLLTWHGHLAREKSWAGCPCHAVGWRWRGACACFVAMAFTRQVELAPFVAAWLYLLLTNRPAAWRLLRNVGGWGLGIAAALTLATRGQFLVHNIYYNANPFSLWQIKTVIVGRYLEDGRFIGGHFYNFNRFFAAAVVVCLIWFLLERLRQYLQERGTGILPVNDHGQDAHATWGMLDLFALYAAVASFGILGLGKIGAAMNYLIEPKAAWSLFIALVLGKTIRPSAATGMVLGRRAVFIPVAVVLAFHALEFLCSSTFVPAVRYWLRHNPQGAVARFVETPFVHAYILSRPQIIFASDTRNPTVADLINGHRIVEVLRQTEGPVFCEHAVFAMRAGKPVYIQPFIVKELAAEGKWDQRPVVEALRKKEFALLVTTEDITKDGFFFHYTREMVEAMREAYRLRETLNGSATGTSVFTYYVFEPRR
jgi:hypothetical protein